MNTVGNFQGLRLDDAPVTAKILQLNTTLTREGAAMAFALGSEAAQGIDSRGQLSASGDIEMYFANFDDYDRYKAETAHHVSYRVRSEEHTSELQSLMRISYAVFCLKKKKK